MIEKYENTERWSKEAESGHKWIKTETYESKGDRCSVGGEEWIETPSGKKIKELEAVFTEIVKPVGLGTEDRILTSSETCKHEKRYVINHQ